MKDIKDIFKTLLTKNKRRITDYYKQITLIEAKIEELQYQQDDIEKIQYEFEKKVD